MTGQERNPIYGVTRDVKSWASRCRGRIDFEHGGLRSHSFLISCYFTDGTADNGAMSNTIVKIHL